MIVASLIHNFLHPDNPAAKWEQKGSWSTGDISFPQLRPHTVLTWLPVDWGVRQCEFAPDAIRACSGLLSTWWGCIYGQCCWLKIVVGFLQFSWNLCLQAVMPRRTDYSFKAVVKPSCCVFLISGIQFTALFDVGNCLDGYALGFWNRIQEGTIC